MFSVRAAVCVIASISFNFGCSIYDRDLASGDLGCSESGSAEPPTRPDMPDNSTQEDVPDRVFALRDVVLDTSENSDETGEPYWKTTGFNLDNRCTDATNELWDCLPPGTLPVLSADGERGIDNTFGPQLFPLVDIQYQTIERIKRENDASYVSYAPDLQRYSERVLEEGRSTLILRLRRWNGTPNDPSVTVAITQSVYGMAGDGSGNAPTYVADAVPAWNGDDWFWVRDDTFVNNDLNEPKTFDNNAYVRDGTVVVRLPDRAELIFVGPGLGLRVSLIQGIATGTLNESGGLDDVRIGGRWTRPDLLETSRSVGVCPSNPGLYNLVVSTIDNIADIRSNPEQDGDGQPCDAVSFGVSFRGFPARMAGIVPGPPLPDTCQ